MSSVLNLKKHHAYLVLSANGNGLELLKKIVQSGLDIETTGNPDYWEKQIETFGIDDSRDLKRIYLSRALKENNPKVILVKTSFITTEAQNALLKILEDPSPQTFFFFLMPSKEGLIPTLLSRFMVLEKAIVGEEEKPPLEPEIFLSLSVPARLKSVAKIIAVKDRAVAEKAIDALETCLYRKVDWLSLDLKQAEIFKIFAESRNYLRSRGGSIKLVLENLCLVLPKV
ncbi:MAG: hypothetical protein QY304_00580 [Candidatus Paceibacterota bacterium]|nr:MAG: hypothetical protein QY304_00580 [Candidatus Paceibacterota bacterium]